jgi:hypothetical protein
VAGARASRRRPARGRLPRGTRPAPRLVPVLAADVRRPLRRRAVPDRHHTRLLPGRLGTQDVEVARQRGRAAGPHQAVRGRHPPPVGLLPGLPRRHADLRGDPRALRGGLPEDPEHGALPDLEPLRLRSRRPTTRSRPSIGTSWRRPAASPAGS